MVKKLKKHFKTISKGQPGKRFQHHYHWHQENVQESFGQSMAFISLGGLMVITGSLLSIPPGVPGFLVTIPGLGLIASRLRLVAVTLDRAEIAVRASLNWVMPGKEESPKASKIKTKKY